MKSFHPGSVGLLVTADQPRHTILLVEDDDQVRAFIKALLTGEGYSVIEARTGMEGYEKAVQDAGRIDLLLSDMLLPELSGFDLAVKLREASPELRVLFITGYVEGDIVQRCTSELKAGFLDKPFQPGELKQRVREVLAPKGTAADRGR